MAKQLYDYWFVQFDFPDENGKPYKSSGGKMVWNDKLGRKIPAKWNNMAIKDIAISNREILRPLKGINYKYFSIPSYDVSGTYSLEEGSSIKSDKFVLHKGQLLVSKLNPWFNRVMWVPDGENMIGSTEFVALDACDEQMIGYLYSVIKSPSFVGYCSKAATGTSHSQRRVSPEILMLYQMPFDRPTIMRYSQKEMKIHDLQNTLMQEISALTKQRNELLPLLMNGQVSVNYHLSIRIQLLELLAYSYFLNFAELRHSIPIAEMQKNESINLTY